MLESSETMAAEPKEATTEFAPVKPLTFLAKHKAVDEVTYQDQTKNLSKMTCCPPLRDDRTKVLDQAERFGAPPWSRNSSLQKALPLNLNSGQGPRVPPVNREQLD